jgi:hypothetical protein
MVSAIYCFSEKQKSVVFRNKHAEMGSAQGVAGRGGEDFSVERSAITVLVLAMYVQSAAEQGGPCSSSNVAHVQERANLVSASNGSVCTSVCLLRRLMMPIECILFWKNPQ